MILAAMRTYLRLRKFRCLFVDDYFLFFAVLTLSIGSGLLYVGLPYAFVQANVESGLQTPDVNFTQQTVKDRRFAYPATMLLVFAIFSVKISFLFLFKSLIRRVRHLIVLWWCVLCFLIPSAVVCICGLFIGCSDFGTSAVGKLLIRTAKLLQYQADILC